MKSLLNKDQPLISVLMPAYNCGAYIHEAIESILHQTYRNFELLICDDASTDNTLSIIRKFDDSRIKVITNTNNLGSLETRNNLFCLAKGELITFQDADDTCSADRLRVQASKILETDKLMMCGTFCTKFYENGQKQKITYPTDNQSIINHARKGETSLFCAASVMFSKTALNKVGLYDTFFSRIGSYDIDWHLRAIMKGKICNIPQYLYSYRQYPESFTQRYATRPMNEFSTDIALAFFLIRDQRNTDLTEEQKSEITQTLLRKSTKSSSKPRKILKSAYYRNTRKTLTLIKKSFNDTNYRKFDTAVCSIKALLYLIIAPFIPNKLLRLVVCRKRLKNTQKLLTIIESKHL